METDHNRIYVLRTTTSKEAQYEYRVIVASVSCEEEIIPPDLEKLTEADFEYLAQYFDKSPVFTDEKQANVYGEELLETHSLSVCPFIKIIINEPYPTRYKEVTMTQMELDEAIAEEVVSGFWPMTSETHTTLTSERKGNKVVYYLDGQEYNNVHDLGKMIFSDIRDHLRSKI